MSQPSHDDSLAIGVDLGATKIATTMIDRAGRVLGTRQTETHAGEGPAHTCDRIGSEIRALLNESAGRVIGVGIGSPGVIDSGAGIVRDAINLGWREAPLAREITERVGGKPVTIANDADANAIGEGMFGSAAGSRHYVLLTVGSGLGCGVVTDGRLIGGKSGIAADLGHFAIDPDRGMPCRCGNRGCAETVVSGPGLVAAARGLLREQSHASCLRDDGELKANAIVAAARDHDPVAIAATTMLANSLGHIAAVAASVVNPELVIIGGGLGVAAFDLIAADAQRELNRRLPPSYRNTVQFRVATLASPAVGAASLVFSRLHARKDNA